MIASRAASRSTVHSGGSRWEATSYAMRLRESGLALKSLVFSSANTRRAWILRQAGQEAAAEHAAEPGRRLEGAEPQVAAMLPPQRPRKRVRAGQQKIRVEPGRRRARRSEPPLATTRPPRDPATGRSPRAPPGRGPRSADRRRDRPARPWRRQSRANPSARARCPRTRRQVSSSARRTRGVSGWRRHSRAISSPRCSGVGGRRTRIRSEWIPY